MPLPINTAPKYQITLPVTKRTVEYRPFVVKEEKILLMASESKDEKQMVSAIRQVIENCTFGNLNVNQLPTADLEYLFLNLRAKSAGETATPNIKCHNCENTVGLSVDLTKVDVKVDPTFTPKIQLTKSVGVMMRYPNYEMLENTKIGSGNTMTVDENFKLIAKCIERIYDDTSVYDASEYSVEEIKDFLESLTQSSFSKIAEFFEKMPKLEHEVEYNCVSCKHHGKIKLAGIQDFFT